MNLFDDPESPDPFADALDAANEAQVTAEKASERMAQLVDRIRELESGHDALLSQMRDIRQTTADIMRRFDQYTDRVDLLSGLDPDCNTANPCTGCPDCGVTRHSVPPPASAMRASRERAHAAAVDALEQDPEG